MRLLTQQASVVRDVESILPYATRGRLAFRRPLPRKLERGECEGEQRAPDGA